ncbi:MAG: hemagglutinin repeat-containing protein [Psychrilyobacter sp.]|uniref:hemagglutinin repeat-containing protein n=1 Tax=Psychrilyobacter sp. TaxID=2586924 RepID=UPI003C747217
MVINARETIELEGETKLIAGKKLDLTGKLLKNAGIINGENVNVNTDEISNTKKITGEKILDIDSDKIFNSGKLTGKEQLNISGDNQIISSGDMLSNKDVNITKFSKIINTGNIVSNDQLSISEVGTLTNEKVIQAEKVLNIWGDVVNNSGKIYSSGSGNLKSDFLTNEGLFYADGELTITADKVTNAEGGQIVSHAKSVLIDGKNINNSGQIESKEGTKIINGTRFQNNSTGKINSRNGNVIVESGVISSEGSITGVGVKLTGKTVNNSGQVISGEDSTTIKSTVLTNSGLILSKKNISITSNEIINRSNILAGNYFNDAGELHESEGTLVFTGTKIENEGKLKATTGIQLTSKNLKNSGTIQNVRNILSIDVEDELLNSSSIYSGGTLNINSKNSVINTGDIYSKNKLDIKAFNLNNQKKIQGETVNLTGNILENRNTGTIYASTDTTINIANINNEGNIFAKENLGIKSNNLSNKAEAQIASNNLDVNTREKVYNEGKILAQNNLNMTTVFLETQSNSVVKGSTTVNITADKIINRGNILTEGTGNINTRILENTATATLASTKKVGSDGTNVLNINADESVSSTGTISNEGSIYSAGELHIKGDSLKNTGNISSIGDTTAILTILKNEGIGEFISAANLILNIENGVVNSGKMLANKDILLTIANIGLVNDGGIINASRKMSLITKHVNNNSGQILSGQETRIHAITLENNEGKLITNGSLIIDLTKLGTHKEDYTLTGTVYGDKLIEITNFNNIINDQIGLMSNGHIKITSTEKNINNSKKIVAGKNLTLMAEKGYVTNEGTSTEEALLSSGENLTLVAKNYVNNHDSKLYGGTGETSITLQEDFENKGKMLALGNIKLEVADGKKVTNRRQIQANGSLNITADKILLKESTSLYATNNIELVARVNSIINEAGAQILALTGDINLKATSGNIYNKANISRGAKIKAGRNVVVEAINFYNEAIKYKSQQQYVSPYNLLDMSDAEIWKLFLTTSAENKDFKYGVHYTGRMSDSYFSQTVGMSLSYGRFFDYSYSGSGSLNSYITSDNITKDYWLTRTSSGWEDFIGHSKFRANWVTNRAITFKAPSNTIRVRQASLESGGDINLKLTNNLENGGVIRADNDITINANEVHNSTLEEQIKVLEKMNLHFKVNYYTSDRSLTGFASPTIKKIFKLKNYVAQDKAIISAGRKANIVAKKILNKTTLGNTVAYTDSIEEDAKKVGTTVSEQSFESKEKIVEHHQEGTGGVLEHTDSTVAKKPEDAVAPTPDTTPDTTERIKGVDLIIDPKENIDIPDGDSGIFIRKNVVLEGASNPLIETNVDFINQDNYYGSGYVFEKLSKNPQDYNRRLGDNYYETTLVNKMYLKATGGRKLEGQNFNEISLMKYLLDNSVLASQKLGLTVGKELTSEQMAKLDKDIVWYVVEEVDGVKVLVPKIYVTSNSVRKGEMAIDSNDTGSVISGEYVTVDTDKFENIGSTIHGNKLVNIQATSILNKYGEGSKGTIKGGDISLHAINDIKNIGASIAGSGNVFLKTEKGDIINETTVEREKFFDGFADKIKNTGAISGKNVVLNSGRDITNTGGVVVATEKISATAKGSILLDALKLKSKTERHTRYEVYKEDQEINLGSSFKAGTGVYVAADKDVNIRASSISSRQGDVVITGDSVTVEALKNKKNTYYNRNKTTSWFDTDEETVVDNSETLANASIDAGAGNVKIVSNKDVNLIGSTIKGAGDENLIMSKEGDVNIKTIALERHYKRDLVKRAILSDAGSQVSKTITGNRRNVLNQSSNDSDGASNAKSGRFSSAGINTSAEGLHGKGYTTGTNLSEYGATGGATVALFNSTEVTETLDAKVHGKTSIEGGSVTIAAKNDVNLESVNIDMKNTVKIVAQEGDVNSTYVQDEIKTSADQKSFSLGAGASYNVQILQVIESVKKQVDYSKDSEYSTSSPEEIAMRAAEFGGQLSKLTGAPLVDGAVEIGLSISESHNETQSLDAVDSTIKAKDIIISAKNGKVDLKGMQMEGTESVAIDADSFNLEASKSEYHAKENGYHTRVTLKGTASVNLKSGGDLGAEVGVEASTVNSHTDSVTHKNAVIKGKSVSLHVTNDANLKGANIKGDTVSMDVGGDLNIESLQDTLDHELHSSDVNASVGASVDATGKVSGSGSLGATYGNIHENKKWVKTQSGISGGNVKIRVDGNTDLKGATIASDTGNLDFTTGSLTSQDLKDSHVRDGGYAGFGGSFSKDGVDSVDVKGGRIEGFHKAQTVKSTIGAGNVVVGGKRLEDTGLGINRDTDKSIVTTQDEKHFKFDLDYTISPGDFKRQKKNKDSDVRKRNLNDDSDNPMRKVDVDGTDVVVRRRPTTSGGSRRPKRVTSNPTTVVENRVNTKVDISNPSIDTGKRNKINTIVPTINSGRVTKVEITKPTLDSGRVNKIVVKQPTIDSGLVKKIDIGIPTVIVGDKIVDKINKPVTFDGEKTKTKIDNLKKEIDETIKLRKEKLGIGTPEYGTKLLKSPTKEEAGKPAEIKDYTPRPEPIYEYSAKKGSEVSLGKEMETILRNGQGKPDGPYVATNKLLAAKIKGQEDFFRNKGYKDSIGDNYGEIQKNQLHKIVRGDGPNNMKALDEGALMKFINDLDMYDQGLRAAKIAHDKGDTKAATAILKDIKDFSNIKVSSKEFNKYSKEVKQKEKIKESETAVKNKDKKITPTEKDLKEAEKNGGYFIRKENGKLVKYNVENILKDTKFTDDVSGSVVTKDDFKTAEYNKELGGKVLKISEDSDNTKFWVMKNGEDKPVIKEVPKYKFEKDTEKFRDPITDKTFTKAQLKERKRVALDDTNTRFMKMDEDGKVTIEKEVKYQKPGSEKLLDPKTGDVLKDASGKEITVTDLESVSKTVQDFGGQRINGAVVDLMDGRKVVFKEKNTKTRPESGEIIGIGGKNFYRTSGAVDVADSTGKFDNGRDFYLAPTDGLADKYKSAEIFTEERSKKTSFVDEKTGLRVTKKDFEGADFSKKFGGRVLETNDPNRKLVLKDGESEPIAVELPKTKLVPGTEFYVDSDTGAKVKPEDIKNAPINKLLGQEAVKISDGRYFTLNDKGEVSVTQIDKITVLPGKVVDPKTNSEISDSQFKDRKEFNADLDQESVKISDGRYFVQDTDGKFGIREIKEVQERSEASIDPETGKQITKEGFEKNKKYNEKLSQDAIDLGGGRYFVKDGDRIQIKEIKEVQERPETAIDPLTRKEMTTENFEKNKKYNEKLGQDAADLGDGRYLVKDGDEFQIKEMKEVQEKPETLIDPLTRKEMTTENFEKNKKYNEELGQEAVDLGGGRYFVKDGDRIQIKEIKEVQERPETAIDPLTRKEMTTENFEKNKRYSKELDQNAVSLGDGRYFIKDESGNLQIATTKKSTESVSHIMDPKTKQKVKKEDIERSDINSELGEKGIKIDEGRYFTLDKDGNIIITEIVKHDPNVYLDETTNREVKADDIKNGEYNDVLGQKSIKIDDSNYFVLNDKGEVEVAQITTEARKDYDIIGEGFEKRITQEEYRSLKENPELNGKVVDLGDGKLLVMKADGEGYITNSKRLEKKVATETINSLIRDAISKNDPIRLKEILNQGKDNTRISPEMKADLNGLYIAGNNKKVTDKQLIETVKAYMEKPASGNYMDDNTGRIFDLNKDSFKGVKENSKDKTKELKLNSKEKLIVDTETGDVKLRTTKTKSTLWEGRKDWLVYKGFKKVFGKKKDKDKTIDSDIDETRVKETIDSRDTVSASSKDITIKLDKNEVIPNTKRLLSKKSEVTVAEDKIESGINLKRVSEGGQADSSGRSDFRRKNSKGEDSDLGTLLAKYKRSKDGITGEEGHLYKLNSEKEGKVLAKAEKSYEDAKNKYESNPTGKNHENLLKKEQKFKNLLKKNEPKMDLITSQEKLNFESALDRTTKKNDKYRGKVEVVKKEEIGILKPVTKADKEKINKDILKAEYTKGLLKGDFYQGKPDIVDVNMRPENIVKVKDNTVNILIHGTYSAIASENEWASSKSAQAKAVEEQYGGKSVAFKWSGKNTADTRKEAGKELAQIIEGYNRKGIKVNIIAHSHGGNVVNEALKLTDGNVENLVTLGTPVRNDHKVDSKTIEKKTGHFLNVMSNEDKVTKMGGFDTKTDITKYLGGDNTFRRAHRKDMNADKILKIDGASHSDLHGLAVIKQLKPLSKNTKTPMRGAQGETIVLKEAFKSEYGKDLKDLKTNEKMVLLKYLSKKSKKQKLDYTEQLIASGLQSELETSKAYKTIEDKIDKEFSKRVLADEELSETLAGNKNKKPDGTDGGIKKSDVKKIIKYRMEAFEKVTGIKPKKEVEVVKLFDPKGKVNGFYMSTEAGEKIKKGLKNKKLSDAEIQKILESKNMLSDGETEITTDKIAVQNKQKQEEELNRTLERLRTLSHELTHKEQQEIIRDKKLAEKLGVGEDRKLFKYAVELNNNGDSTNYRNNIQERDAFTREKNMLKRVVNDLEKKGHKIVIESKDKVKISKPTLIESSNKDFKN